MCNDGHRIAETGPGEEVTTMYADYAADCGTSGRARLNHQEVARPEVVAVGRIADQGESGAGERFGERGVGLVAGCSDRVVVPSRVIC